MGALQVVSVLLRQLFQNRVALAAENLSLRQQIAVLQLATKGHERCWGTTRSAPSWGVVASSTFVASG